MSLRSTRHDFTIFLCCRWAIALLAMACCTLACSQSLRAQVPSTPSDTATSPSAENSQSTTTQSTAVTSPAVTDAREVVAHGSAIIGAGGIDAARKAAIAQALKDAVEQTTGVYVSARTLTKNYQLVQDQVITHAAGFATLISILSEKKVNGQIAVEIRARVSLRPLAKALQTLNLIRTWRVHVEGGGGIYDGEAVEPVKNALEKALLTAGIVLVSSDDAADVLVQVTSRFDPIDREPATSATGKEVLLHVQRLLVNVRVVFAQTGELIAILDTNAISLKHNRSSAIDEAADNSAADIKSQLTDTLILLPTRATEPVQLEVGDLGGIGRAAHFEEALRQLPFVTSLTRRRFENGNGLWKLEALTDSQGDIAEAIEDAPAFKLFHVKIMSQSLIKIVGSASGIPPSFSTDVAPSGSSADKNQTAPPFIAPRVASVAPRMYAPSTRTAIAGTSGRYFPPAVLVYEGFDYLSGTPLSEKSSGYGWSTPWSMHGNGHPSNIAGALTYQNLKTSGGSFQTHAHGYVGDDRTWSRSYGIPGEILYVSVLVRPLDEITVARSMDYFGIGLGPIAFGKIGSDYHFSLYDTKNLKVVPTKIPVIRNQTYFLVARITFGERRIATDLFVDPSPGQTLPAVPDASLETAFATICYCSFGSSINCVFDEFRVGNTYADVAPVATLARQPTGL